MLIDMNGDEELTDLVKDYISAMLPHENFEGEYFGEVLETLTNFIKLEEMEGEFHILLWAITNISNMRELRFLGSPKVKREVVKRMIIPDIVSLIYSKYVKVTDMLIDEGAESTNLDDSLVRKQAGNIIVKRVLTLYDECFERSRSASDVLSEKASLVFLFKRNVIETSITAINTIVEGSLRVGRMLYSGYDGSMEYSKYYLSEMQKRLDTESGDILVLDTVAKANRLNEESLQKLKTLFMWDIPVYDHTAFLPDFGILKHRYIVMLANPSGYKTSTMCCLSAKALLAGKTVNFMCGESSRGEIMNKIKSSYLYQKYGKMVHYSDIAKGGEDLPEEARRLIRIVNEECSKGNLQLLTRYSYANLEEELDVAYEKNPFDVVILDHSAEFADDGKTEFFKNLSMMSTAIKSFRRRKPVACFLMSHLSSTFKGNLEKGKITEGGTKVKGNAEIENDADEIYYVHSTDDMKRQCLLELHCSKRRDHQGLPPVVRLSTLPICSSFEYREDIQLSDLKNDEVTESMVLDETKNMYASPLDGDDEDTGVDFEEDENESFDEENEDSDIIFD